VSQYIAIQKSNNIVDNDNMYHGLFTLNENYCEKVIQVYRDLVSVLQ